jgi:hypothetical protein
MKKTYLGPRDVDNVSWALFCVPRRMAPYPSPAPSVLVPCSSSPSSFTAAAVLVVWLSLYSPSPSLSLWLPLFFVVASSPSSPCQLFPPREQLLAAVGCWWPSSSLPHHPLSLPHCPCRRMSPCFVVVLIHHPPHEQVLVAVALLWVCRLGAVSW